MSRESFPETEQKPSAPETEPSAAEVMEQGQAERGSFLKGILTKAMVKNGLDRLQSAGGGMVESVAAAASSGKDFIARNAVEASLLALDATGLAKAAEEGTIVGTSHKVVGFLGKTLSEMGNEKTGRIFAATSRWMKNHPGSVAGVEKGAQEAIKAYRAKNG